MADRKPDNQDQKQQNSKNNQFNFHVLIPHLPMDLSSLLSELLGLKMGHPSALNNIRLQTKGGVCFKLWFFIPGNLIHGNVMIGKLFVAMSKNKFYFFIQKYFL